MFRETFLFLKVLEIDGSHEAAQKAKKRLEETLSQQSAAMKEEMIGSAFRKISQVENESLEKLKDLGNTVLGKFGVSIDDFKTERDPETGSYNLSFKK